MKLCSSGRPITVT